MRPFLVVPLQPVSNGEASFLKRLKDMLSDTLFFETAKEPLDDSVLFRRVGCNKFLPQPIVPVGLAKPATLTNQPIVTAEDRCTHGTERAEPLETGRFHGSLGLLGPAA